MKSQLNVICLVMASLFLVNLWKKLVAMTNFGNDEAIRRFQYIWRLKGIDEKLREKGIKEGDSVFIGEMEFEYKN